MAFLSRSPAGSEEPDLQLDYDIRSLWFARALFQSESIPPTLTRNFSFFTYISLLLDTLPVTDFKSSGRGWSNAHTSPSNSPGAG